MKTRLLLPNHLRFLSLPLLPTVQIKNLPQERSKRVRTKGDWECASDPHGRYAYLLESDFSFLHQWRIGADGILSPLSPYKVEAHSHPNTVQYHPNEHFAYVTCSHGAICQYRVHSGALIPLNPPQVYANNDPTSLWFDRTGHFACVINLGEKEEHPPNDRVRVYRIGKEGRLALARQIEVSGTNRAISRAAWSGARDAFTVSGDRLS